MYGKDDSKFNPSGIRKKRGLYISRDGTRLNADINGALNILRKNLNVSSNVLIDRRSRGLVVSPSIVKIGCAKTNSTNFNI